MKKKIMKKCIGTLISSLLLTALPSAVVGAQTAPTIEDRTQQIEIFLLNVKELIDQGIYLEQIQNELQIILNSIYTDIQMKEKISMSLRGFYGNDIFSCRGFA